MLQYLKMMEGYSDAFVAEMLDGKNIESHTYAEYLKDMRRCAYQLEAQLGDIDGKHICIISKSNYKYMVLLGAIIFSRAVAIPLNNLEIVDNIRFAVNQSEADVLIYSEYPEIDTFKNIVVINEENLFDDISNSSSEKELYDFTEEESQKLSLIIFTSGTTSLSKGVALSVFSLFGNIRKILPLVYRDGIETAVNVKAYTNFPFYHMGGILLWISWTEFGSTICMSKNPKHALADLENITIDYAAVTPAMLKVWINCIKRGHKNRTGNVRHLISGGALIEPPIIKFFVDNDITFGQYYGMTEIGNVITGNFDMENHIDSIGKAIHEADVFCIDGEICVKAWSTMMGYYNNPQESEGCLQDGVIYTGDLGRIDEDGYLYITGRKKNLIILSGGENVSPEEIETKVYENSLVKECKVFEKNDRVAIEVFAQKQDEEIIREYIRDLNQIMPAYKKIYFVEFRDTEFEKTVSGKIKR